MHMQYMIEIKNSFLDRYDMTDMGRLSSFLNILVTWEETGVRLDKQRYAKKVLRKHAGLVGSTIKYTKQRDGHACRRYRGLFQGTVRICKGISKP